MARLVRVRLMRKLPAGAFAGLCVVLMLAPAVSATQAADTPDLTLDKTSAAEGPVAVGDSFSYTIAVANEGAATAHGVTIEDDLPVGLVPRLPLPPFPGGTCSFAGSQGPTGPAHHSVHCQRPSMPAGAAASVIFTVEVTDHIDCGEITNTASVEASDEPASDTANNTGSATDTIACPPSIAITKTAPAFAHVGETIGLAMAVTNRGSIDFYDVRVTDAGCSGAVTVVADGDGDATLAPGETWRYRCAARVRASTGDHLASAAIVLATSADGPARASDRTTVRVLRPGLTLRVTPDPASGSPGDTITYRFVVRNTGNATLTTLSVDDDQLGHVGDVAQLVPGHTATFTVQRLLSARHIWVTDRATATGTDPAGRRVRATHRAAVTVVGFGGTGPAPRAGVDGTAFTGAPIATPLTAAIVLAFIGAAALLAGRRHRA